MAKQLSRLHGGIAMATPSKLLPVRRPLKTLEAAPDPIDGAVDYTGDVEKDANAELSAIQAGFRARAKQEAERFKTATGSNFYFCVVFDDGDQADAFLKAVGTTAAEGDLFIDGRRLADRLGIELPASNLRRDQEFRIDPKMKKLSGINKP